MQFRVSISAAAARAALAAPGGTDYIFGNIIMGTPNLAAHHWDISGILPIDLKPNQETIEDQGVKNECVGEGITTMLELFKVARGYARVELSPDFTYKASRWATARALNQTTISDNGTSAATAMTTLIDVGACTVEVAPPTEPINDPLTPAALAEAAKHKVMRFERVGASRYDWQDPTKSYTRDLEADLVVGLEVLCPSIICVPLAASFFNCTGPLDSHPAQWEPTYINAPNFIGAHCMCVIGWKWLNGVVGGERLFIVENSWGPGWGDGGFWGVRASVLKSIAFDCFTIRDFDGVDGGAIPIDLYVWEANCLLEDGRQVFISEGPEAQMFRLYQAAFDRRPDETGLGYWVWTISQGPTLTDIAGGFLGSPEGLATYGGTSNELFVTLLYHNVLHREPDAGGHSYWTNLLNAGTLTRPQVLVQFSESAENKAACAPVIQRGVVYQPYHP